MKTLKQNKAAMLPTSAARQHQFLQRAGMLSFAALLLGVGTASAQQNHFLHAVAKPTWLDSSTLDKHHAIQVVDIDGDMDKDLFLANGQTESMLFMRNDGTPTNPDLNIQSGRYGLENYPIHSFAFGDMDNDGDQDIVYQKYGVYGSTVDSIVYLANRGTATNPDFSGTAITLFGVTRVSYVYSMSLVDLDNDGDLDLLTHDGYQHLMYYTNNGGTTLGFTSASVPSGLTPYPVNVALAHFAFADMDNDGDQDIWRTYEALSSSPKLAFIENTGNRNSPTYGALQEFPMGIDSIYVGTANRIPLSVSAPFDIDDDGDTDILSYGYFENWTTLFENTKCDTNNTAPIVTQSSNTISTGAGLSSYQWYSVDAQGVRTPVQGATSATFAPTTDGSYTVRAKKTNGCVAYSADFAFVHIGVNSVADANLWNVSPNPVTSELFVQSDLTWLRWEIIDAQGRVIRTIAKPTTNSINVSELPQGIYTLRGQAADGKSAISRFVKK